MATTGIVNGTNLRIYLDTGAGLVAVAEQHHAQRVG